MDDFGLIKVKELNFKGITNLWAAFVTGLKNSKNPLAKYIRKKKMAQIKEHVISMVEIAKYSTEKLEGEVVDMMKNVKSVVRAFAEEYESIKEKLPVKRIDGDEQARATDASSNPKVDDDLSFRDDQEGLTSFSTDKCVDVSNQMTSPVNNQPIKYHTDDEYLAIIEKYAKKETGRVNWAAAKVELSGLGASDEKIQSLKIKRKNRRAAAKRANSSRNLTVASTAPLASNVVGNERERNEASRSGSETEASLKNCEVPCASANDDTEGVSDTVDDTLDMPSDADSKDMPNNTNTRKPAVNPMLTWLSSSSASAKSTCEAAPVRAAEPENNGKRQDVIAQILKCNDGCGLFTHFPELKTTDVTFEMLREQKLVVPRAFTRFSALEQKLLTHILVCRKSYVKNKRKTYNFNLVKSEWKQIMQYYQIATKYDPATSKQQIWDRTDKLKQHKNDMQKDGKSTW